MQFKKLLAFLLPARRKPSNDPIAVAVRRWTAVRPQRGGKPRIPRDPTRRAKPTVAGKPLADVHRIAERVLRERKSKI